MQQFYILIKTVLIVAIDRQQREHVICYHSLCPATVEDDHHDQGHEPVAAGLVGQTNIIMKEWK